MSLTAEMLVVSASGSADSESERVLRRQHVAVQRSFCLSTAALGLSIQNMDMLPFTVARLMLYNSVPNKV